MNPVLVAIMKIRIDISIVNGRKGVTPIYDSIDCPTGLPRTTSRRGGLVVPYPVAVPDPAGGNTDGGV